MTHSFAAHPHPTTSNQMAAFRISANQACQVQIASSTSAIHPAYLTSNSPTDRPAATFPATPLQRATPTLSDGS
ncbi:hypothetical protein BJV77DRAFT_600513 [Russula vinacea]|nr:hypothetical protein BJV77DRAFT_600513 [Russula vinacea]